MKRILPILLFTVVLSHAQITSFPYKENFDSVAVPSLPAEWTTSKNKNSSGDFTTSTTTVRSSPNCLSATNGKISQSFISPVIDLSEKFADSLFFYERRTSTHLSGLFVEASINGDTTFSIPISDTLKFVNSTSYVKRSCALPEILNGKANIRFRWRVLADSASGSTGIIRFDDISITIKKAVDLAVTSFTFSSNHPQKGNTVSLSIGITNKALAGNFSFILQLFDSLSLVITQTKSISLSSNDSTVVQMNYSNINAGRHPLSVHISLTGDEDTTNNSASTVFTAGYQQRNVLINEIMYAPANGKEWIEVINNSADTIDLVNWKISDRSAPAVIAQQSFLFYPQQFVVFAKDTMFKDVFPDFNGVIIRVSAFPTLNNDSDAIVIIDPNGLTIDSLTYHTSWGGTGGKSLERIDTATASTAQSNWKTSRNSFGATPGKINSVTKKDFDAAINAIAVSPKFPVAGNSLTITTTIKNAGKQDLSSLDFLFYIDTNNDSLLEPEEIQFQQHITAIRTGDSLFLTVPISSLLQGTYLLAGKIMSPQDDDSTNNIFFTSLTVSIAAYGIVVNEIMYAPPDDMPEWIECYNTTESAIDLKNWKISDATLSKSIVSASSAVVPAHSYFLIAHDSTLQNYFHITAPIFVSSFSALNNSSADAVVLFDDRGLSIDSVYYHPAWSGTNGQSLQRFDYFGISADSSNWKSEPPNPGNENTIARKDFDVEIRRITAVRITDGTEIRATIFNIGRQSANSLRVKIFHDTNNDSIPQGSELLSTASMGTLSPLDSSVIIFDWNVSLPGVQTVIATVEFSQDQRLRNNISFVHSIKNFSPHSLIINEIMYEPKTGDAEFVELYNPASDSLSIDGWTLMDSPSSSGSRAIISLPKHFIPAHKFFIIASDSIILKAQLDSDNVLVNPLLNLSNGGEDIVLSDVANTQIDSIRYSPSWHLKNITTSGRSLEKISPTGNGIDSRNWSSSVSPTGSSPLQKNSIYTTAQTLAKSLKLSPNPFSPDNDGFEDFLSITYSLPNTSSRIRVRIFDVAGRLIRRLAIDELSPIQGSLIWNGLDDNGVKARIGMYIILFETLDNFGGVVHTMKDVVVVGTKL